MLGLDDVGGGTSYVTTAGSQIARLTRKAEWETGPQKAYQLFIYGLRGGHSGVDIEKERGNAVKLAGRTLYALLKKGKVRLADVNIGEADNVIAGEGTIVFTSDLPAEDVLAAVKESHDAFLQQLHWSDPDLKMELKECTANRVVSEKDSADIIGFVRFVPDGYFHHSMHFEGLTTVSSNIGTWKIEEDVCVMGVCSRSSIESFMDMIVEEQKFVCDIYGIERTVTANVAGFDYIENSPLRASLDQAFFEVTGKHIQELFVHGGLEAGYITRLIPGMDVATIGPLVPDEHTVNERLNLKSFEEIWNTIVKTLAAL